MADLSTCHDEPSHLWASDPARPEVRRRAIGRRQLADRVERAIRDPGPFAAGRELRAALVEHKDVACRELVEVDRVLADAAARRQALVERIEACNLAMVGTRQIRDRFTGEVIQNLNWAKRIPFHDPQPQVDEPRRREVSGRRCATPPSRCSR